MKKLSIIFCLATLPVSSLLAETLKGAYDLKASKVEYVVSYLIKKAEGASVSSKGKGECSDKGCDFLVAAPIKSFESKDSNRDFNMLKATKADQHPVVVAKFKTPADLTGDFKADVELDFGGTKKNYPGVVFKTKGSAQEFHAEGNMTISLEAHHIDRPSLLGVKIEDNLPLTISADWIQRKN